MLYHVNVPGSIMSQSMTLEGRAHEPSCFLIPLLREISLAPGWSAMPTSTPSPHSFPAVSSQLEGLFISLAGISCGGHMEGESTYGRDVSHLRCFRLAQFAGRRMLDAPRVAEQLAPLVVALHGLFWPLMPVPDSVIRTYREDVKAHEVQKVCVDVVREHCKDRALLLV